LTTRDQIFNLITHGHLFKLVLPRPGDSGVVLEAKHWPRGAFMPYFYGFIYSLGLGNCINIFLASPSNSWLDSDKFVDDNNVVMIDKVIIITM